MRFLFPPAAALACCLTLLLSPQCVRGQHWVEYWQRTDFRSTNFSDAAPVVKEDFLIHTSALRAGLRRYAVNRQGLSPLRLGFDVYGRLELVHDLFNGKPEHNTVFNNHVKFGGGVKARFEREWKTITGAKTSSWLSYLQVDAFAEFQRMDTFVEKVRNWFDYIEQSNFRMGVNAWANSGRVLPLGQVPIRFEMYFDLSYHSTNFSDKGSGPFLILTYSPRIYHPIADWLDIYINGEIIRDLTRKEDWNYIPFNNNLKLYGGLRFKWQLSSSKTPKGHAFSEGSLLFFFEQGWVSYLDLQEKWAQNFSSPDLELAPRDFRFGIIFWLPTGEAKYRPVGQQSI